MKVFLTWDGGNDSAELASSESDVWKWIAKHISSISIPNVVTVKLQNHGIQKTGKLEFIKRGLVKHADGTTSPSLFVKEADYYPCDFQDMLTASTYKEAYLVCINPTGNNYKFYWLKPDNNLHLLGAQYGRLGSKPGERFGVKELQTKYKSYMYWIRYYEKLSKGYVDMSNVYLNDQADIETSMSLPQKKDEEIRTFKDSLASIELYNLLLGFAQNYVNDTLAEPKEISWGQIKESQKLYSDLCTVANHIQVNGKELQLDLFDSYTNDSQVTNFNVILEKLMTVSPRRVELVSDFLARTKDDFAEILRREDSLINAMKAVKTGQKTNKGSAKTGWLQFGIDVEYPNDDEKNHIMSLIDPSMRGKVEHIYMIHPDHQQSIFNSYCLEKGIKKTQELFHGSGLENWFSITENSLLLPQHNNARKTGQALGAGLYFGNNSIKSSHYACRGSHQIIGLFDVAYGKPMKILDSDHNCYFNHDQAELDSKGCNCLHYHRKGVNWADEIVVYSERAVCMEALILLKN